MSLNKHEAIVMDETSFLFEDMLFDCPMMSGVFRSPKLRKC